MLLCSEGFWNFKWRKFFFFYKTFELIVFELSPYTLTSNKNNVNKRNTAFKSSSFNLWYTNSLQFKLWFLSVILSWQEGLPFFSLIRGSILIVSDWSVWGASFKLWTPSFAKRIILKFQVENRFSFLDAKNQDPNFRNFFFSSKELEKSFCFHSKKILQLFWIFVKSFIR